MGAMSEWNYFATAQEPTAVVQALGPLQLTSQEPTDLVVAFANRLEIFRLEADGRLVAHCKFQVNGRVALLAAVQAGERSRLFLCTQQRQFALLSYDMATQELTLSAFGKLGSAIARQLEGPPLCACDPSGRVVAVHAQALHLSIVVLEGLPDATSNEALDINDAGRTFSCDLADQKLLDLSFMHSDTSDGTTSLVTLHVDSYGARALAFWTIDVKAKCITEQKIGKAGAKHVATVAADRLVPVSLPLGGVMVLGSSIVAYHDATGECAGSIHSGPRGIAAVARVASARLRWLVGGADGSLWQVALHAELGDDLSSGVSPELVVEHLGMASPAAALVSLTSDLVFVGCACGDSQVVRIREGDDVSSRLGLEDAWTSLAPIVDFCVADVDGRGQSQVAACCGLGATGSLRLVRVGVGVNEVAAVDGFAGVMGMWVAGSCDDPPRDACGLQLLVLTFVTHTRVFSMRTGSEAFTEESESGLLHQEETLLCGDLGESIIQVTATGIHAMSLASRACTGSWSVPTGVRAQAASIAPSGVLVGVSTGHAFLLRLQQQGGSQSGFDIAAQWALGADVACLHVSESLCVAALWTPELCFLWPQCEGKVCRHSLPEESVPRSVIVTRRGAGLSVLIGMGNGWLQTLCVDEQTGACSQQKLLCLGTLPVRLSVFRPEPGGIEHILATGTRPTIIHETTHGQFATTAVNLPEVSHAAQLPMADHHGCLALVSNDRLLIGALEEIQKVHVQTVPLGQSPHCICWLRSARAFAIACQPEPELPGAPVAPLAGSADNACASLKLVDCESLDVLQSLQMGCHERICSLCPVVFEGDPTEYLAVGTALVHSHEHEPLSGQVMLYRVHGCGSVKRVDLVAKQDVSGAVYTMSPFLGMLLGSVNNRVVIWRYDAVAGFSEVCSHCGGNTLVLHLRSVGERIFVGDMMRSASLLVYRSDRQALEEIARYIGAVWLSAAEAPTSSACLCADDLHNLFVLAHRSGPDQASEPRRLERVAQMHVAAYVSRLQRATLADAPTHVASGAPTAGVRDQVVWASTDGAIGLVAALDHDEFARLSSVQHAVAQTKASRAWLQSTWRDVCDDGAEELQHRGFVDGDLVEEVLLLPSRAQEDILGSVSSMHEDGVSGLLREIENLARLH